MEDEESFSSGSALLFAVVSFILYWLFLRPTAAPTTGTGNTGTATPTNNHTAGPTSTPRRPRPQPAAAVHDAPRVQHQYHMSQAAAEILSECQSKPKHVSSSIAAVGLGGSNVILSDSGLVAFAHTEAASVVSNDSAASVRQERAKILSRLCHPHPGASASGSSSGATPPPLKGSTLVVSISQATIKGSSCLPRILYVLGTFYNLVVIVGVDDSNILGNKGGNAADGAALQTELVEQLRGSSSLSEDILPSHRILVASTVTGRVALVRQLAKVAMVVDWDPEVDSQLTRFGYKVALVPNLSILLE